MRKQLLFQVKTICSIITKILLSSADAENIVFFYALDADLKTFQNDLEIPAIKQDFGPVIVSRFLVGSHTVYAAKMGSGCIQTAISTTALLSRLNCQRALSVGPVGRITGEKSVGEWLWVSSVTSWQKGSWENGRISVADSAVLNLEPEKLLPLPDTSVISVASGETFITSSAFRSELAQTTKCEAVDMNLAGLCMALKAYNVKGTHLRIISDLADENAATDFKNFSSNYKGEGGQLAARWIKSLPIDATSPNSHPGLRRLIEKSD